MLCCGLLALSGYVQRPATSPFTCITRRGTAKDTVRLRNVCSIGARFALPASSARAVRPSDILCKLGIGRRQARWLQSARRRKSAREPGTDWDWRLAVTLRARRCRSARQRGESHWDWRL